MTDLPTLDDRTYAEFSGDARALIPSIAPVWTDHNPSDPGIILVELFAWLSEIVLYRLDRVPERSYRTFLTLLRGAVANDPLSALPLDDAIRSTVSELRDRYRAITPDDFEYLARVRWPTLAGTAAMGASGVVRRAHCLAEQSPQTLPGSWQPNAPSAQGHFTVIVVPDAADIARGDLPAFAPTRQWVLELDGVSAYVDCGADATLSCLSGLTLSAWVFPRSQLRRQGLVCKAAVGEYELVLEPNGALSFLQADGTDGGSSAAGVVPIGRWSHVASVRAADGRSVTLYVNGESVGTIPLAKPPVSTGRPLWIGQLSAGGGLFDGFMRDVTVWSVARAAVELGGDMRQAPLGVDDVVGVLPPPGLPVAAWRFDTTVTPVPDCETPRAALIRPRDGALHGAKFRLLKRPLEATPALLTGLAALFDEWRLLTTQVDVLAHVQLRVTVSAKFYLRTDGDPSAVRAAALAALDRFLDPLTGWQGEGWPFSRPIYNYDLGSLLDGIPGVDFVTDIQVALADPAEVAKVALKARPPAPTDESGNPIGVAPQPSELPTFDGATFTMFQRVGTKWQQMT